MSAVASTQYINYLIEKGFVLLSEKDLLLRSVLSTIEAKFELQIPYFVADGLIEIMSEVKNYDYEIIGIFINKVNNQIK